MWSLSSLLQPGLWPYLTPILLLFCLNLFMTFAWYGHLKFKSVPLFTVILISWGMAFVAGIFLRGAGEPVRQRGLFACETEDDPRGCHADRVRGLHRALFRRAAQLDAVRRLRADRARRGARVSRSDVRRGRDIEAPDGRCRPEGRPGAKRP